MNESLRQLKDIHMPPAISDWPIAPGWIFLLTLLIVPMLYFMRNKIRERQGKKAVKFAIAKLKKMKEVVKKDPSSVNLAVELSILLRRTAIHYFLREDIAGLTGEDWLKFLNESGNTNQFTATGRLLIHAPYQKTNDMDLTPLFDIAENWLIAIARNKKLIQGK